MRSHHCATVGDRRVRDCHLHRRHQRAALPDGGVHRITGLVLIPGSAVVAGVGPEQAGTCAVRFLRIPLAGAPAEVVTTLFVLGDHIGPVGHGAGGLSGQVDPGGPAETEVAGGAHNVFGRTVAGQATVALPHPVPEAVEHGVAGDRQCLSQGHRAVRPGFVVAEGLPTDHNRRRALVGPVECEACPVCGHGGQGLERRGRWHEGLDGTEHQRPAPGFVGQVGVLVVGQATGPNVRVVGRVRGDGADGAGLDVHDDHGPTRGPIPGLSGCLDGIPQRLLRDDLGVEVQGGHKSLTVLWGCDHLLCGSALPGHHLLGLTTLSSQRQVVLRLETGAALIVSEVSQDMCGVRPRGVVAHGRLPHDHIRQGGVLDRQGLWDRHIVEYRDRLTWFPPVARARGRPRFPADGHSRLDRLQRRAREIRQSGQRLFIGCGIDRDLVTRAIAREDLPGAIDDVAARRW